MKEGSLFHSFCPCVYVEVNFNMDKATLETQISLCPLLKLEDSAF